MGSGESKTSQKLTNFEILFGNFICFNCHSHDANLRKAEQGVAKAVETQLNSELIVKYFEYYKCFTSSQGLKNEHPACTLNDVQRIRQR